MKRQGVIPVPTQHWPSHIPFEQMINCCTQGTSDSVLKCGHLGDHIAETVEIRLDDVDHIIWSQGRKHAGTIARKLLGRLEERISRSNDIQAAETLYAVATEAALGVLRLYLRDQKLFCRISPSKNFLPSLFSIHPNTAKVMARMLADSRLGSETQRARQVGSKAYFVSDSPPNVYARAIIACVDLNRELDPISTQQRFWKKFDRKEGVQTILLPFPKYVEGLDRLPSPISSECVLEYWRKGKEMILEEMPDFHFRPEWKNYHKRKYKMGAKPGAIQHAIFKDILVALKTIAGSTKQKNARTTKPAPGNR